MESTRVYEEAFSSSLRIADTSCLADFSFFIYCSLCFREGHYSTANNLGVAEGFPSFHLSVKCLFILLDKRFQVLSLI